MESDVGLRPEGFDVTTQKQLKARIRGRMAATGERYAAARAQLVGAAADHDHSGPVVDAVQEHETFVAGEVLATSVAYGPVPEATLVGTVFGGHAVKVLATPLPR